MKIDYLFEDFNKTFSDITVGTVFREDIEGCSAIYLKIKGVYDRDNIYYNAINLSTSELIAIFDTFKVIPLNAHLTVTEVGRYEY